MTLYICYYKNEDWCCYVAALTRGKAKHLFNEDGFIGFAGWADQGNTNPLLRAFLRWCDDLAAAKEAA